jgi:fatty acid desaturase
MSALSVAPREPGQDGSEVHEPAAGLPPPSGYRLDPQRVRALSRVDARCSIAHITLEWSAILICAWLCQTYFSLVAWAAACVFIGSRLHALGVMAHDGAHYLLARDKRVNDLLVELFLAWPVFLSLDAYRRMHHRHHRALNTPDDPDWARNRPDRLATRRGLVDFVRIMGGLHKEQRQMLRMVGASEGASGAARAGRATRLSLRLVIYAVILVAGLATGGWKLLALYWLAPFATWFMVSMRLKGTAEHFAVHDDEACNAARTLTPGPLGRWFIAPKNVHLHIEHHLYPSVPFYHLPALHKALMEHPDYRARAHLTRSYAAFLLECLRFRGRTPDGA